MQSKQSKVSNYSIKSLSIELDIPENKIIAALGLSAETVSDTPLTAKQVDILNKALNSTSLNSNVLQLKQAAVDGEFNPELSKKQVKEIANELQVRQYTVSAIADVLFEKEVVNSYFSGKLEAQNKNAESSAIARRNQILEDAKVKGINDFEESLKEQEMLAEMKRLNDESENLLNQLNTVENTSVSASEVLERMGLSTPKTLKISQKTMEDYNADKLAGEAAIAKLERGELLTDEEKKIFSVRVYLQMRRD